MLRFASCETALDEVGLPEHRSEHQAPRRIPPTTIPNAVAEPPSERSVFGEPDRHVTNQGKLKTRPHGRSPTGAKPLLMARCHDEAHTLNSSTMTHVTTFDDATSPVDQLRAIGREFHSRSWSLGTSSNYSVVSSRDPLELLITASGKDKSALGPDDFVRVDSSGRVIDDSTRKSSAETLLHCLIADLVPALGGGPVGAVLHTHSVWSTILSRADLAKGSLRIEGYEMLKGLEGIGTHDTIEDVPIFANGQDMTELAGRIRDRFTMADWSNPKRPPCHGFLLSGHGLYTWGQSLAEARRHIEIHEFLFEVVARGRMLASATHHERP